MLTPPFDSELLMRKQRSIKRELLAQDSPRITKRIALLGGSTTADIRNMLEIFLLDAGIAPEFYESEYNQYYEDAVFSSEKLDSFAPEIIIIFTSFVNLKYPPSLTDSPAEAAGKLDNEYARFRTMWDALAAKHNAVIIQNNFDLPYVQPQGTAEFSAGLGNFVNTLNVRFSAYAAEHAGFYVHDLHRLCAQVGLARWHDRNQYCLYKLAVNYDAIPEDRKSVV